MPIAPEKSVPQPVVLSPEQQAAIAIDEDYEKVVIQKITDDGDGRYTIDYNNNSSLSYKVVDGVPPKVGEVARFYYTGNGNLRGLVVGGRTYYYRDKVTPDIEEALTKINIQEEGRLRVVKAYEALPPFMRSRVDFNAATAEPSSPSDNRSAEEIFEDEVDKAQGIVYLVKRFKTPAAIDAFLALPYEQQCERDPGIRVFNGGRDAPPEMIREFFEAAKWYLRESAKEQ
jgi:hypothetical protein